MKMNELTKNQVTIDSISLAIMVDVVEQAEDEILEETDDSPVAFFEIEAYLQTSTLLNLLRMAKNAKGERQQMIMRYAKAYHRDIHAEARKRTPECIKALLQSISWQDRQPEKGK
jgi:hypothetical protein